MALPRIRRILANIPTYMFVDVSAVLPIPRPAWEEHLWGLTEIQFKTHIGLVRFESSNVVHHLWGVPENDKHRELVSVKVDLS